jgi:16S rRNA (guanine527-N7)-methyltransferase
MTASFEDLVGTLAALDVPLDRAAVPRLEELRALVLEANERLNLTRVTEETAFKEKHVLDSLAGLRAPPGATGEPTSWVDLGAGGGFPGLAIAIARPLLRVVLVEGLKKKASFLEDAARKLGLSNVTVVAGRAEEAVRLPGNRDAFDRASARAVGTVALCLEYALPFVRTGGFAVLYRGPDEAARDESEARATAPLLGGGPPLFLEHALPGGDRRRLLFVPKTGPTPERFPRRTGVAAKRPLA